MINFLYLGNFLTDCCVIGNVSTLGVGLWGFKSLQSDIFNLLKFYFSYDFFDYKIIIFIFTLFMPQLVPFYYLHLLTFGITTLVILIFITSKYLLPNILRLLIARVIITRL